MMDLPSSKHIDSINITLNLSLCKPQLNELSISHNLLGILLIIVKKLKLHLNELLYSYIIY